MSSGGGVSHVASRVIFVRLASHLGGVCALVRTCNEVYIWKIRGVMCGVLRGVHPLPAQCVHPYPGTLAQ